VGSHFCAQCGTGLRTGDLFCWKCGARVVAPAASPFAEQQRRRYALIGGGVLLLLLVIGGLVGYAHWREGRALAAHYALGAAALEEGDYQAALQEFNWVAERSPDYKDVQAQRDAAQAQVNQANVLSQAEAYCAGQQWESAITSLETLQEQTPEYKPKRVQELLFMAHWEAGVELVDEELFDQAIQHFDEALALRPDDTVERQRQRATLYAEGLAALERGDCASATEALGELHGLEPTYHHVGDKLYEASTCYCTELSAQALLDQAEAQCQAALQIKPTGAEAVDGLEQIAYLRTPTATPTPSPSPTWTPSPTPRFSPTPLPTPTPSATPTPTKKPAPSCRRAKKGLIGFKRQKRCDKKTGRACGPVRVWVMNPNGSGQAPMCNPNAYYWGLKRDRTSPDGAWRVEVGGRRPDIMRVFTDGRQEMIIVNNRKDWDPVLSLDGWWLAWVTNRNANDEIYIKTMDPKDQNQRRLTVNDWEWDKHPTWSPDGRKIAFYSNRANSLDEATRQIWVMDVVDDQGVNLRNLSNKPNKVDIDPVWFKWDDMPY
jgi:tetratricopeptide (TPR) repeat protein